MQHKAIIKKNSLEIGVSVRWYMAIMNFIR